jgi:hypothetical protein
MMVAPGDQRGARRRTQCRRVVHVVPKSAVGETLKRGRLNRPAKRAARTKTDVVGQDQKHVRRTFRRFHSFWEIGGRILYGPPDFPFKGRLRLWQNLLTVEHWNADAAGQQHQTEYAM